MALDLPSYLLGKAKGGGGGALEPIVVDELPETGEVGKLYLVPRQESQTNNVFDEYIYVDDEWEKIGTAEIDLSGKQDKMQFATMPTANADNLGKIYQYIGTTNANYTNGYFYICLSDGGNPATYSWASLGVQDISGKQDVLVSGTNIKTINNISILGSGNIDTEVIQYSTIPTANADNLGKIVQYTGADTQDYTNGYFYQVVSDGLDPATYSWENTKVQDGGNNQNVYFVFKYQFVQNKSTIMQIFQAFINDFLNGLNPIIYCKYSNDNNNEVYSLINFTRNGNTTWYFTFSYQQGGIAYQYQQVVFNVTTNADGNIVTDVAIIEGAFNFMFVYNTYGNSRNAPQALATNNTSAYTPTSDYHPSTKLYTDKTHYENMAGYDATKTQVLKNINGTLTWVDEA